MSEPTTIDGLQIRWAEAEAQAVDLRPGDVAVLMLPRGSKWSEEQTRAAQSYWAERFPETRVLVLEDGMRLGVLRPTAHQEAS